MNHQRVWLFPARWVPLPGKRAVDGQNGFVIRRSGPGRVCGGWNLRPVLHAAAAPPTFLGHGFIRPRHVREWR